MVGLKHKLGSKETIKSVPLKAPLEAYRTRFLPYIETTCLSMERCVCREEAEEEAVEEAEEEEEEGLIDCIIDRRIYAQRKRMSH